MSADGLPDVGPGRRGRAEIAHRRPQLAPVLLEVVSQFGDLLGSGHH
jgi:hypothetical protein